MDLEPQPCIWMTAGLLRYRLCDRGLDCDHCPLDAALRGAPAPVARAPAEATASAGPAVPRITFPPGRRYGECHTWIGEAAAGEAPPPGEMEGAEARTVPAGRAGPVGGRRARFGIDALAAALLGPPLELRLAAEDSVGRGDPLCELVLDAGPLPLASPVAGRVLGANPVLEGDPGLAAAAPYGAGWLVEMAVEPRSLAGSSLLEPAEARRRAGLDLRHFRRRLALHVLAAAGGVDDEVGATLPDGGELVTDLRGLLGPRRYLELLQELVR